MESPITFINLSDINTITYFLKMFFIGMFSYYTFTHILNIKPIFNFKLLIVVLFIFIISSLSTILKYDYCTSILFFIFSSNLLYSIVQYDKFAHSFIVTLTSISINYILHFVSIFVAFLLNIFLKIQHDLINFAFIFTCHCLLIFLIFRIKKFKYGLEFLKSKLENDYFDILILNISITILLSVIIFNNYNLFLTTSIWIAFILSAIIMFIAIKKSLNLYYKHKLLVKDLNDTKSELDKRNIEFKKLEKENLEFSKTSHTIAHKQRVLEYKIQNLMFNSEFADELDLRNKVENISKQYLSSTTVLEIPKTDIPEIDDMLKFLHSECTNNNIDFEVQLNGNIHHMTNTFISKEDLEILLADHIKNSIIAINSSDNINKSILVKLGLIDNYYSLYIYDSGIEFKREILPDLGKIPMTTHPDIGGSGLGFMNTFDTLEKYNASLIINELNPPCTDNYTKSIIIIFDNRHDFNINSYRL